MARSNLLTFGSATALALALGAPSVMAQTQSATPEPGVQEVVVTGVRLQNRRAIDIKRDTLGVVDSLTADDVGRLPDFNAGDALRRVPGVNVFFYQGEPRHVSLRGLNADYNSTTVDGFHMASPDPDGRRVFVEVLPSSLASRIDVVKTARADIEGHAIGGTVNFVSRSQKDLGRDRLRVSGRYGTFFQDKAFGGRTPSYDLDVTGGFRFGPDNAFGLVVSASHWARELFVPQLETGGQSYFYNDNGTRSTTPYGGNGQWVPSERRWYVYDNDRDRSGLSTKLDWTPGGDFSAVVSAYYYQHNEQSDRYETTAQVQASATVAGQTPRSGTLSNVNQIVQLGQLTFKRSVYGLNLTGRYQPSDDLDIEARLGWSGAHSENPQRWDQFQQNGLAFGYQVGDPVHTFTAVNPTLALDPARYALVNHRDEEQRVTEHVYDAELTLASRMKAEGFGYKVGARYQRTVRSVGFERVTYTGTGYTLADTLDTGRGLAPFGSTGKDFFAISLPRADAAFERFRTSLKATPDVSANNNGDYRLHEDILGLYAMGRYQTGPWTVSAGVRYEQTDVDAEGRRNVNSQWVQNRVKTSRGDVLPSATLAYAVSDDLRLTASVSRALGRARSSDLAPRGETLTDNGVATPTLSRANPDIKPRLSTNLDLALDWFFDGRDGLLSVALFRKSIENEIFTFGQLETVALNGQNREVLVTQARNSPETVTVDGIEIGFVKNLTFLPAPFDGLGVSGNLTLLNTDFPVTLSDKKIVQAPGLREQAEDMLNLNLFYNKGPIEARVAYNRVGKQWESRFSNLTSQAEFYRNRFQQPFETVDLQVRYALTDRLSLQLEGQNIFDERKQDNIGRAQEIPQALIGMAPAYYLGASYRW
ncbi:MAG: TonB-dependent receptor [Asticcacaulis sp.]